MNKLILIIILCLVQGTAITFAETAGQSDQLSATIAYLLLFVEKSDCIFIRNNKTHTAKEAVSHMQRKYDHFKNDIKTPEDFIRLAASKSLMSGKAYMVKTKSGRLMKSETWLLEALETYRNMQHREVIRNHAAIYRAIGFLRL